MDKFEAATTEAGGDQRRLLVLKQRLLNSKYTKKVLTGFLVTVAYTYHHIKMLSNKSEKVH
jgi:hypothetical protein